MLVKVFGLLLLDGFHELLEIGNDLVARDGIYAPKRDPEFLFVFSLSSTRVRTFAVTETTSNKNMIDFALPRSSSH